jgi:hypothetical protein
MMWRHLAPPPLWVSWDIVRLLTIEKTRKHDISNIPYNLIFNDSSILITIILCDYLNLSLEDEHVGDVTIPTQVFEYNQNFLHAD